MVERNQTQFRNCRAQKNSLVRIVCHFVVQGKLCCCIGRWSWCSYSSVSVRLGSGKLASMRVDRNMATISIRSRDSSSSMGICDHI